MIESLLIQEKILEKHYLFNAIDLTVYKHLVMDSFPQEIRLGTTHKDLLEEVRDNLQSQGFNMLQAHTQALTEITQTFSKMDIYKPVLNEKYATTIFRVENESQQYVYAA